MRRKFKFLHREVTRHGKVVWYVRPTSGRRVRIDETLSREDFGNAYAVALAEALRLPEPKPTPVEPLTKKVPRYRCIYILTAEGEDRPVKIGISVDPESRLRRLRSGNHKRLQIACIFRARYADAGKIETMVKGTLRPERLFGEWIDLTVDDVGFIIRESAKRYDAPLW